jgi:MYXO-CTERM domain-containing protein
VEFPLAAGGMTLVGGSAAYSTVLGSVATLRILHSTVPDNNGQVITGSLGVDNITARSAPVNRGDYDNNGVVDAADYVVWRKNLSMAIVLPNDATPGSVTASDYAVWRANFGDTLGSGSAAPTQIPEPAAWLTVAIGGLVSLRRRRRADSALTRSC